MLHHPKGATPLLAAGKTPSAAATWKPYSEQPAPTSCNRTVLSEVVKAKLLEDYGLYGAAMREAVFQTGSPAQNAAMVCVMLQITTQLQAHALRSFARPFGGGEVQPIAPEAWEIDDPLRRFSESACDPLRLFDGAAEATHWIFCSNEELGLPTFKVGGKCTSGSDRVSLTPAVSQLPMWSEERAHDKASSAAMRLTDSIPADRSPAPPATSNRLLRIAVVVGQTGISKSTIYKRMAEQRFPKSVSLGGGVTAWREAEIIDWIRNPT